MSQDQNIAPADNGSTHRITIVVTGSIAAFKSATVVSQLVQAGHDVTVVMTEAAQKFVGAATMTALTGKPTVTDLYDARYPLGAHIELARNSDLMCVAPATAHFLAAVAQGHCNDLVSSLYLCHTGPVLVAPAMNVEMWQHVSVQRNVTQLRSDGVHFVDPEQGWLSCRAKGQGRMAEPETVIQRIASVLHSTSDGIR